MSNVLTKKPHLSSVSFLISSVLQSKSQCCSVIAAFHSEEFKSSILLQHRSPGKLWFDIMLEFSHKLKMCTNSRREITHLDVSLNKVKFVKSLQVNRVFLPMAAFQFIEGESL